MNPSDMPGCVIVDAIEDMAYDEKPRVEIKALWVANLDEVMDYIMALRESKVEVRPVAKSEPVHNGGSTRYWRSFLGG